MGRGPLIRARASPAGMRFLRFAVSRLFVKQTAFNQTKDKTRITNRGAPEDRGVTLEGVAGQIVRAVGEIESGTRR